MTTIKPWLHRYNYIADFYDTVNKIYETSYVNAYPVTYYSLDFDASIMDKEQLNAGTYERFGIGELSGALWKKIYMLPVFGIDSVTPRNTADEKGVTLSEEERTKIVFPSTYGIVPNEWDIVHFSQEFMMKTVDITPLFVVTNVSVSNWGDFKFYECSLKPAHTRDNVEKQISDYYMYLDMTRRIHGENIARLLLKLQGKSVILSDRLNDLYDEYTGFYLHSFIHDC